MTNRKKDEAEGVEDVKETETLTGSGAKFLDVQANVNVLGLRAGENGQVVDSFEVRQNIEVGNLTKL